MYNPGALRGERVRCRLGIGLGRGRREGILTDKSLAGKKQAAPSSSEGKRFTMSCRRECCPRKILRAWGGGVSAWKKKVRSGSKRHACGRGFCEPRKGGDPSIFGGKETIGDQLCGPEKKNQHRKNIFIRAWDAKGISLAL